MGWGFDVCWVGGFFAWNVGFRSGCELRAQLLNAGATGGTPTGGPCAHTHPTHPFPAPLQPACPTEQGCNTFTITPTLAAKLFNNPYTIDAAADFEAAAKANGADEEPPRNLVGWVGGAGLAPQGEG